MQNLKNCYTLGDITGVEGLLGKESADKGSL